MSTYYYVQNGPKAEVLKKLGWEKRENEDASDTRYPISKEIDGEYNYLWLNLADDTTIVGFDRYGRNFDAAADLLMGLQDKLGFAWGIPTEENDGKWMWDEHLAQKHMYEQEKLFIIKKMKKLYKKTMQPSKEYFQELAAIAYDEVQEEWEKLHPSNEKEVPKDLPF